MKELFDASRRANAHWDWFDDPTRAAAYIVQRPPYVVKTDGSGR